MRVGSQSTRGARAQGDSEEQRGGAARYVGQPQHTGISEVDTFDVDRDEEQNRAFGYEIHSCGNVAVAPMECAIALKYLLNLIRTSKACVAWR
jgi:hypothetical protein